MSTLEIFRSQPIERPHLYTVIMLHPAGADVQEFCDTFHGLESPKIEHIANQVEAYRRVHWIFPSGDCEMPLSTKDEETSKSRREVV